MNPSISVDKDNKIVTWEGRPPEYISYATHKFSFLDAVEIASNLLRTDYVKQEEKLIVGREVRQLIVTLPHFIAQKAEMVGKFILLGKVGDRSVFLDDTEVVDCKAVLDNGKEQATIQINVA